MSELASLTPWPIEKGPHPLGSLEEQRAALDVEALGALVEELLQREAPEDFDRAAFLQMVFANPQYFRDLMLRHVRVTPREDFEGKGIFYVWLNKACPVGCEFCFFKSPAKGQAEILEGPEGIGQLVQFVNGGDFGQVFVTGGGEPMMKPDAVNDMAQTLKADQMILITSAYFAQSERGARIAVERLRESAASNPKLGSLVFRLSLDEGHLEKLGSRGKGFRYVHNLINALQQTSSGEDKMTFLIHTMMGDSTVDGLLAELPVVDRQDVGSGHKKLVRVTFEGGFEFTIEYALLFKSDTNVDLNQEGTAQYNDLTFQTDVMHREGGNMAVVENGEGSPAGLDWIVFYDGSSTIWSTTPPDVEGSIYGENYKDTIARLRKDPIVLGTLESGAFYRDGIAAEANPRALLRARGMGLRDQFARVLMEEEGTRLYMAVRMLQDFIAHGRIAPDEMASWPEEMRALVMTPKEELIQACRTSKHDILNQYLVDPRVTAEKLHELYRMVRLGHYNITPSQMVQRVAESNLEQAIRLRFVEQIWNCTHAAEYVRPFSSPAHLLESVGGSPHSTSITTSAMTSASS